jgi:hypothetical protein
MAGIQGGTRHVAAPALNELECWYQRLRSERNVFAVMSRGATVMNGMRAAAAGVSALTAGTDDPIVTRVVIV